jgi:flagellar motility protein MotE (MotC chaperone)
MSKRKRLERMNDRLAEQAAKWQMAAIAARRQVRERDQRIAVLEKARAELENSLAERDVQIAQLHKRIGCRAIPAGPWETGTMPLAETKEARCDRLIEVLRTGDTTCDVSTEVHYAC